MANVARVASIFWTTLKADRQYGGPFSIGAAALNAEPVILTINDAYQIEYGPYGSNSKRKFERRVVDAYTIAADLVREWAEMGAQMNPSCRPGVWVVRDRFPVLHPDGSPEVGADGFAIWRDASEAEKSEMFAEDHEAAKVAQVTYANAMFNVGEAIYRNDPRKREFIHRHAYSGSKHYGREAEWLKEGAALKSKMCPMCIKTINEAAIRCPYCQGVVDIKAHALREVAMQDEMRSAKESLRKTA